MSSYRRMTLSLILLAASGITACAPANQTEEFACPTPAPSPTVVPESPPAKSDRQLLSDPAYFDQMLAHSNNEDLRALLRRAQSIDNYAYADKTQLDRVEKALAYRERKGCGDVPSFAPNKNYVINQALPK